MVVLCGVAVEMTAQTIVTSTPVSVVDGGFSAPDEAGRQTTDSVTRQLGQ